MNRDAILFVCLFALTLAASNTPLPPLTYAAGVAAIYLLRRILERWDE
nr:hypothetical protein [uncultured Roseateles sp.]